jgi:hypothetical protein
MVQVRYRDLILIIEFTLKIDQYAILMIPSSLVAFQVITAIIAFITIITWGLTTYLLAFHIYLCKQGISTYDYVVNRRINETVDQTLSQFNQLNQTYQNDRSISSKQPKKVYIHIYFIFYLFLIFI